MKIKNSLKALMTRHRDNRMVRRKGRVYIINKKTRVSKHARADPVAAPKRGCRLKKPSVKGS